MLTCEGVPLNDIAAAVGTPAYIYSRDDFSSRARILLETACKIGGEGALVCYAVKANANPTILRLLGELGLGADVTSGGELFLARHAEIDLERIIFSGVGKKPAEIAEALTTGIRAIHVESEMELSTAAGIAEQLGIVAAIGVRVNPNINARTHPYISTGLHGHKFGVPRDRAVAILRAASEHPWLRPVAMAAHVGSQIVDLEPFAEAAAFLVALAEDLRRAGIRLEYIDAGGGLGIDYLGAAPDTVDWVETVGSLIAGAGYGLVFEPGRSIVGRAGALLTQVVYTKQQGNKQFIITDAGMTDLIRPTLYQAHHAIVPVVENGQAQQVVDVVGPICETSDFLARERPLPPVGPGDLLAVLHAGAYGYAMSSNYNGHLRPAEVLVDGDSFRIIRERQTRDVLIAGT